MERKLCPLSIISRRGAWAIPGVQELDKEVPRPVLGLGTPPAIVGPLGWLSLGKLAVDPHPVPLPTSLVPLGRRESHLGASWSLPWRPAPSGCAQQDGVTSVRDPLSRRGPEGVLGGSGAAGACPLPSCS